MDIWYTYNVLDVVLAHPGNPCLHRERPCIPATGRESPRISVCSRHRAAVRVPDMAHIRDVVLHCSDCDPSSWAIIHRMEGSHPRLCRVTLYGTICFA
jgi:hypothetical protein